QLRRQRQMCIRDSYKYTQAGADLVIYSGAKAIEGPSSGLVIGTAKYIEWVRLQGCLLYTSDAADEVGCD
ncbi:hypothetical protein KQJ29_39000, partial [Enterococcus sp. S181_ASV_20]|nr:hypothetical protein [Enterococcus sp. S181_ASV_20]